MTPFQKVLSLKNLLSMDKKSDVQRAQELGLRNIDLTRIVEEQALSFRAFLSMNNFSEPQLRFIKDVRRRGRKKVCKRYIVINPYRSIFILQISYKKCRNQRLLYKEALEKELAEVRSFKIILINYLIT